QELAGRRIAGVVLIGDAEIEIAERNPYALPAPAHMHDLALERHVLEERRAGLRRRFGLEPCVEGERAGGDFQLAHGPGPGVGPMEPAFSHLRSSEARRTGTFPARCGSYPRLAETSLGDWETTMRSIIAITAAIAFFGCIGAASAAPGDTY